MIGERDRELLRDVSEARATDIAPSGFPFDHVRALASAVLALDKRLQRLERGERES
jgi:hypothetical protein